MIDVTDSNSVYYYHFDGLGSVVALSNANKEIVERYSYDVFGEPNRTSDVNNPYLFTSRRYDSEAGLYYYRARYYACDIGRFLQPDLIGYNEGMNMYSYVGNNPLAWVDPLGLCKGGLTKWDRFKIASLERLSDAIGWWYEKSGGEEMERYLWEGRHVGTPYGEEAVDYYARKFLQSKTWYGKAGYYTGGLFASLWTKESWKTTATTVVVAGVIAEPASKTGPWLGKVAIHGAHGSGSHMYRHIQIMIRVAKHVTKHFRIPLP